jgi:hypothetical protein
MYIILPSQFLIFFFADQPKNTPSVNLRHILIWKKLRFAIFDRQLFELFSVELHEY